MPDSPGRITLWGIEVFVAAAEEGSISAAARRLGASPSSVSQQLTNLESALGVALLMRNTRPMALTHAGELFRRRASAVLNEASLARAELAMAEGATLTRFRLGMIEDFEANVTPRLLTQLAEAMTGCQFLLETGASHFLHDQLDARALDVVFAAEMGDLPDWAEVHPVLEEGFVVAAPKGAVDAGGDVLAQLKALPLVQYTTRHYMGRLVARHLAEQKLTLDHRFELDSYHAILALVGQGAGWTILTPLALRRARRFASQMDVLALPFAPLTRRISVMARAGMLQDTPAGLADRLRGILKTDVITPAAAVSDVMGASLRLLEP